MRNLCRAALTANGAIFCAKMAAWIASGGSSLLAEAIHSAADIGNQAMLRLGIVKAAKAPTKEFPYGHLREKFIFRRGSPACMNVVQLCCPRLGSISYV
jgi:divalent metal cation (Fe/Co/Zn/Cd) transporter